MPKSSFLRILLLSSALMTSHAYADNEVLDNVTSEVYETPGTPQEITKKAKICMVQLLHNDEVRIADSSSGTGFMSFAVHGNGNHSSGVTGGPVIVDADIDAGTITANSRVDYTSSMLSRNVKSTVIFEAKEGKFRIRHTAIEYLMKDTGGSHNSGYSPVVKVWGTGWADAESALKNTSEKLAACIKNPKNDSW